MKHGDQVKTPNGLGIYFGPHEDTEKAYVVLKSPTENKIFIPLVDPGYPIWECFACDVFSKSDLTIDKTLEQRQAEAYAAAQQARMQQEALLREKMRQFEEAQKRAHEQKKSQSQN